jgi:two-component system, sensor histidine kinase and response regulator
MWIRFLSDDIAYVPMQWAWMQPYLVAISVAVSVCSAMLAVYLAGRAQRAPSPPLRQGFKSAGALCLGGGIWGMHFIGMQAFTPCSTAGFAPLHTTLSILPSLLAAALVMHTLAQPHTRWGRVLLSGVALGLGVTVMHFWGMYASEATHYMDYAPLGLALALGLGMSLAIFSVVVYHRMRLIGALASHMVLVSGAVMGLATASMHYIAMDAIHLPVGPEAPNTAPLDSPWTLLTIGAAICLLIGVLLLALNIALRWRQLFADIQRSEARLRAVVETAVDGMVMIEGDGRISAFNPAAERLLGWKAEEVLGRNVNMLMPNPHQHAHDGYLQRHLATGHTSIIGSGREVQALHKDGSLIDIRLAVGRVAMANQPLFVGFLTDIRQRKSMQRLLQRSEEQHRTLISNMPGVAFRRAADALWRPLFLSQPVEALTGWPAEALLADSQRMASLLLDGDAQLLAHSVQEAVDNGMAYHHEYRLRHRDGSVRWVSENGRAVYDADGQVLWIDGVLIDNTETRARNAEFEGTVAAIDRAEAVIAYSMDGHVLSANANFLRLFGYTLDEVLGAHFSMFCLNTPEVQQKDTAMWQTLQGGEHVSMECQARGQGGRLLWLQTTFSPILDANGKPLRITQLLTDITASRTLAHELRIAKDKAEAAAAARSTFLANMSHEIRTPMNAIIGFSEALLDTPLRPTQHRYVETVFRSSRSMLRLLNDILDTAKLDKGAVHMEIQDFCLADVCHLVIGAQRLQSEKKGVQLQLEVAPQVPTYLRGDALRVQQIVTNLMGNAVKFTERGHVRLAVDYQHGVLHLRVQDSGIGIAPDQLEHIFAPFAQADASTTRRFGGTGLGTTIARQLAQVMGGEIQVYSQLGQGTEFHVSLPLPVGQAPQSSTQELPSTTLPALRILGVDDVPQNLELLQVVMRRYGHTVELAHDGQQAVHMRQSQHFDLILMDLQMPVMDGLQAARRIRAWEAEQAQTPVPIIALSASVLEQDRRASDDAGMDGFAAKPLEPAKLLQEMARVLHTNAPVLRPAASAPQPSATLSTNYPMDGSVADWHTGLQLWGSEAGLRSAWLRFMSHQQQRVQALHAQAQQGDWKAATASVHRMRGAAGNLALPALHSLLGTMETSATQADSAHFAAQLPRLQAALSAVEALLHATEQGARNAATAPMPAPLSAMARAQAQEALQAVCTALQLGEIDSDAMQHLRQRLPHTQVAALQAALDMFDFDQALQAAQHLAQTLNPVNHPTHTDHAA